MIKYARKCLKTIEILIVHKRGKKMAKPIGLILIIAGFVILVANFLLKNIIASLPFIAGRQAYVLIAGIILIAVGLALTMGGRREKEVPIYDKRGKQIVGYRRTK